VYAAALVLAFDRDKMLPRSCPIVLVLVLLLVIVLVARSIDIRIIDYDDEQEKI